MNLLDNAVKYTSAVRHCSAGRVACGPRALRRRGHRHRHRARALSEIFSLFHQVRDGQCGRRHRAGPCDQQRLTRLMGGDLQSSSVPGEGQPFLVRSRSGVRRRCPPYCLRSRTVSSASKGKRRLLIVDDGSAAEDCCAIYSRRSAFRSRSVGRRSGRARGAAAQAGRGVDGLRMPRLNGLQTARRSCAACASCAACVIIAISASAFESDRAGLDRSGCRTTSSETVPAGQADRSVVRAISS